MFLTLNWLIQLGELKSELVILSRHMKHCLHGKLLS